MNIARSLPHIGQAHIHNKFPHKCSLYLVFLHCYSILDTGHGYNTNADRTTAAMQGVGLFFFLSERKRILQIVIDRYMYIVKFVVKDLLRPYKQP